MDMTATERQHSSNHSQAPDDNECQLNKSRNLASLLIGVPLTQDMYLRNDESHREDNTYLLDVPAAETQKAGLHDPETFEDDECDQPGRAPYTAQFREMVTDNSRRLGHLTIST
jgi:hypothetical protein